MLAANLWQTHTMYLFFYSFICLLLWHKCAHTSHVPCDVHVPQCLCATVPTACACGMWAIVLVTASAIRVYMKCSSVQVYLWPNFVTGAMAFDKNHNSVLHYSQCMTSTSDVISLFSFWASTSRLVVYLAWWHTMCNFNYQINYVCVCQHNQPLMYKIFH